MFKEFKEFLVKGNAMMMAIAFILGAAFTAIIKSLVDDIIMPVISLLTGGIDFTNLFLVIGKTDKTFATLAEVEEAGVAAIKYGKFISALITFVLVGFVLFMIVRSMNKMKKAEEEVATTKSCEFCKMEIAIEAKKCPHCTSEL
ncbi:MAG: large conductance mechanosensitive channel protein MscL [Clostridiales bacterium]|nr:MAG: large conductance mechanosensitive channel protein MscL [Clostridiales bacterium]